jgi:Domain of unknown function (DUF309)
MIPAPDPAPPRRTDRPLPLHRFLPGPAGRVPDGQLHPTEQGWTPLPDFAWGCDLFDHRHPWEAHEVWEAEWRSLPRGTPQADLLQGLICAAAFTLKRFQSSVDPGLRGAAAKLLSRAEGLLARAAAGGASRGIDLPELGRRLTAFDLGGAWPQIPG